jgi:hypothetical protein
VPILLRAARLELGQSAVVVVDKACYRRQEESNCSPLGILHRSHMVGVHDPEQVRSAPALKPRRHRRQRFVNHIRLDEPTDRPAPRTITPHPPRDDRGHPRPVTILSPNARAKRQPHKRACLPCPAELMRTWAISTRVNRPENDDPRSWSRSNWQQWTTADLQIRR